MKQKKRHQSEGPKKLINERNLFLLMLALALISVLLLLKPVVQGRGSISSDQERIQKMLFANENNRDLGMAMIIDQKIDEERVGQIANISYDELKLRLGVDKDFVIYFVDQDNSVLPIAGRNCIGSPRVAVDGKSCG